MGRQRSSGLAVLVLSLCTASMLESCKGGGTAKPASAEDMATLSQGTTESLQVNSSPRTSRPSFIRGRIPLTALGVSPSDTSSSTVAFSFVRRNARAFGVDAGGQGLQLAASRTDQLGVRHLVLQQHVNNVPVYNAIQGIHVDTRTNAVVAVSSSLIPDIKVNTTSPSIREDSARALASAFVRQGRAASARLVVYARADKGSNARLAWVVEVFGVDTATVKTRLDTVPVRRDVVIDAEKGKPLDVTDKTTTARNREIHNTGNTTTLPGPLARSEGQPAGLDADVNKAYDFFGSTYNYYKNTHGRDSYDNAGATLVGTVHYDVNYQNAFWNGTQMVFGDGFAVEDVTAHELTHAVTEKTAGLTYQWQSGALNESFSDIFGTMVDRADWQMGEDLPGGAIRDLANPGAFGDPANVSSWVATCSDNQGVHTNSTIFSKAFVNVATATSKNDAERIFYRALTTPGMLTPNATMEDARAAAIQSAVDIFGTGSPQATATTNGFNAVGLDGVWQPAANNCPVFPWPADLSTIALLVLAGVLLTLIVRARMRTVGV